MTVSRRILMLGTQSRSSTRAASAVTHLLKSPIALETFLLCLRLFSYGSGAKPFSLAHLATVLLRRPWVTQ